MSIENIQTASTNSIPDTPPSAEPERQYYYMEKAKQHLARMSAEAGRPLTFCVTTFGCQMNARDSEKLTGILERIGYVEEPDEEKADFVPESLRTAGAARADQEEEAAYDDRTLRLYDAGTPCRGKVKDKLPFR